MGNEKKDILFFCDLDGTLLTPDKKLTRKNADAIARFTKAGGSFIVATGRVLSSTRRYFEEMNVRCPMIICNGGMIYDCAAEKTLMAQYLEYERSAEIIRELLGAFPEVCAEICTPEKIYDVNKNEYERRHLIIGGFEAEECSCLEDVPREHWNKVLFAMDEKLIPEFEGYTARFDEYARFVTSAKNYHEMLPKGCSKGSAVKKYTELFGTPDSIIAAMGDYDNDMEMLRMADIAVCPSNAADDIKAVCGYICSSDCGNSAVAEAIDYLINM